MPLRKLWNSLRSHSKQAESTQSVSDSVEHEVVKLQPAARGASESKHGMRRNKSKPSSELSTLLCQLQPKTILEIGVGDGSRAVEFLTAMKTTHRPVRYFAIDQFELTCDDIGEPTKLRIGHNNKGWGAGWLLNGVVVTSQRHKGKTFNFPCGRWLSDSEDDKQ